MALNIASYAKCCHAWVINDFSYGHISEGDEYRKANHMELYKRTPKETIEKFVKDKIAAARLSNVQVLFACPTNHQPEAIEVLEGLGFFGAPKKDLLASSIPYAFFPQTKDHAGYQKEQVTIEHYMVPMFYLVPRVDPNVTTAKPAKPSWMQDEDDDDEFGDD